MPQENDSRPMTLEEFDKMFLSDDTELDENLRQKEIAEKNQSLLDHANETLILTNPESIDMDYNRPAFPEPEQSGVTEQPSFEGSSFEPPLAKERIDFPPPRQAIQDLNMKKIEGYSYEDFLSEKAAEKGLNTQAYLKYLKNLRKEDQERASQELTAGEYYKALQKREGQKEGGIELPLSLNERVDEFWKQTYPYKFGEFIADPFIGMSKETKLSKFTPTLLESGILSGVDEKDVHKLVFGMMAGSDKQVGEIVEDIVPNAQMFTDEKGNYYISHGGDIAAINKPGMTTEDWINLSGRGSLAGIIGAVAPVAATWYGTGALQGALAGGEEAVIQWLLEKAGSEPEFMQTILSAILGGALPAGVQFIKDKKLKKKLSQLDTDYTERNPYQQYVDNISEKGMAERVASIDSGTSRKSEIVARARPDADFIDIIEDLDIGENVQFQHYVKDPISKRIGLYMAKLLGVDDKQKQVITSISENIDDWIFKMGGDADSSMVNDDYLEQFIFLREQNRNQENILYEIAHDVVREAEKKYKIKGTAPNTRKLLESKISQYQGLDEQVDKFYKKAMDFLKPAKALSKDGYSVTYTALDDLRKEIGKGMHKGEGEFATWEYKKASELYHSLLDDQKYFIDGFGGNARFAFESASKIAKQRKTYEEFAYKTMGNNIDKGILSQVESPFGRLKDGNYKSLEKFMENIPFQRDKQRIMASAFNKYFNAMKGGNTSPFKSLMDGLSRNKKSYDLVSRYLGKPALKNLFTLNRFIKNIEDRPTIQQRSESYQKLKSEVNVDGLLGRLLNIGQYRFLGGSRSIQEMIGIRLAFSTAELTLSASKKASVKKAFDVLDSPEMVQFAREYANDTLSKKKLSVLERKLKAKKHTQEYMKELNNENPYAAQIIARFGLMPYLFGLYDENEVEK